MKVFFLYLLIVVNDGNYYFEKIPFGFTLRPITCEDAWNETVKILPNSNYKDGNGENWVVIMYKDNMLWDINVKMNLVTIGIVINNN